MALLLGSRKSGIALSLSKGVTRRRLTRKNYRPTAEGRGSHLDGEQWLDDFFFQSFLVCDFNKWDCERMDQLQIKSNFIFHPRLFLKLVHLGIFQSPRAMSFRIVLFRLLPFPVIPPVSIPIRSIPIRAFSPIHEF